MSLVAKKTIDGTNFIMFAQYSSALYECITFAHFAVSIMMLCL